MDVAQVVESFVWREAFAAALTGSWEAVSTADPVGAPSAQGMDHEEMRQIVLDHAADIADGAVVRYRGRFGDPAMPG